MFLFNSHRPSTTGSSIVTFPGPSTQDQIIPREFIRSNRPNIKEDSVEDLLDDLTDTVYDILTYK